MCLWVSFVKRCFVFLSIFTMLLGINAKKKQAPASSAEKDYFIRPVVARYASSESFLYPLNITKKEQSHLHWQTLLGLFDYDVYTDHKKVSRQGNFFPFYFFRSGFCKANDYAAVWPLGGTVKNFLGKEEAHWFLWPLWVKTRNANTQNYWYPWPLINYRCGEQHGFGFYPLGGHFFQKDVYDERYFLWPLGYRYINYERQELKKGFLPFYAYEKTPHVEDLSIVWPIWGHRKENKIPYEEHRLLWPLWVQGRGDTRLVNRWAPFYTHSEDKTRCFKKTWYLWPFIQKKSWQENAVDIYQEQFLYFIFWHQEQKSSKYPNFLVQKTHFWPIYSYWNNGQGRKQIQMLSPFEVFFPNNDMVRDIYTPLFALYRYDENNGNVKQSFLFQLFQEERNKEGTHLHCKCLLDYKNTKTEKCFSLLNGFFEYRNVSGEKTLKLLWCQLKKHSKCSKDNKVL